MSFPPPFMPPPMMGGPMPPMSQPPPNFRAPGSATIGSLPQLYANPTPLPVKVEPPTPQGPLITVFVGNISERIPDTMMKKILATCGLIVNWKRVSTFGFCEFDGPIAGARAVRLLNDLEIDAKQLVAKVDAKNKALLDQYQEETNLNATQAIKDANAEEEEQDDKDAAEVIQEIMEEYAEEIRNAPKMPNNIDTMHKPHKTLSNSNVPDEKRDIINQEIGKFRKYTEEQEQKREKEKDRKRREDEKREKRHESPMKKEKKSRHRTPDSEESPRKEKKARRRSEEREREERERMEREREERERIRERERQMERERRERDDQPKVTKNAKDVQREKEMEEEARDRKKQEKKARDKEAAYQERLKNWEGREKRRAKEYDKDREKERLKDDEREKEAKRLKEFLEDYEDERDDQRYYKGRELQRRLADRVREADSDAKDRAREQEELDELKSKIFSGEYENPTQEFERQKRVREEQYKPKLFLHNDDTRIRDRRPPPIIQNDIPIDVEPIDSDDDVEVTNISPENHVADRVSARDSESRDYPQADEDSRHSANTPSPSRGTPNTAPTFQVTLNLNANAKKKKLEVKDVFANDDDQEEMNGPKKRKLVPLDYDEPVPANNRPSPSETKSSSSSKSKSGRSGGGAEDSSKQRPDDEKKRHIKSIIDKIPTEKNALFNYPLDKAEIDSTIEKKIRPWINKKIIEYIGEPEPTLVDFICSKVLAGSTPQGILDDVQMVLDEEAEVFVVKMWRLLIYEVEAKKRNF